MTCANACSHTSRGKFVMPPGEGFAQLFFEHRFATGLAKVSQGFPRHKTSTTNRQISL
jgi:hypothetical protein